jgi:hypothetical protein
MPKGKYERKHAWVWATEETLRAGILRAAREILARGERVSTRRLRLHGVRGASNRIIKIRENLVASGELPPEAGARTYQYQYPDYHPARRPVMPPTEAPKRKIDAEFTMRMVQLYGSAKLLRQYRRRASEIK